MADVINLRRARKAKGRAEKDRAANANRAKFGTPEKTAQGKQVTLSVSGMT